MAEEPRSSDRFSQEIKVSIRNRRKILFDGSVYSVTSFNEMGEFAVLPEHANFVSLVKDKVILDKLTPSEQEFDIGTGLISVDEDGVNIYAGVGSTGDEEDSSKTSKKAKASENEAGESKAPKKAKKQETESAKTSEG